MMSLREYREPKHRLPDYLPWACLVAPGVVLQKDAILQKTIAFRGPDLHSSNDSELVSATARINNALRRLGSGWALFVEAQRFASHRYPDGQFEQCRRAPRGSRATPHLRERGQPLRVELLPDLRLADALGRPRAASPPSSTTIRAGSLDESSALHRDVQYFDKTVAEVVDILRGRLARGRRARPTTRRCRTCTARSPRSAIRCARPETPMYLDALLPDDAVDARRHPDARRAFHAARAR